MYGGELAGPRNNAPRGTGSRGLEDFTMKRGMVFGSIIVAAMLAFELFNYSTTDFALANLLGDLKFMGLRWAMILAIAFCGMDFAGIARLFTPEKGRSEHVEVWYLLAAWFLAATMNAMLTWWGVSLALLQHNSLGNEILSRATLLTIVPVFVAVMVWLIRILMIGTLSMAGERLFSFGQPEEATAPVEFEPEPEPQPALAAPGLHLPTAIWRGSASPVHPEPIVSQPRPAPVARTIGADSDDDPTERRAGTVAERHGYGRAAQTNRPLVQPPLPGQPVRPAPKPMSAPAPKPISQSVPERPAPKSVSAPAPKPMSESLPERPAPRSTGTPVPPTGTTRPLTNGAFSGMARASEGNGNGHTGSNGNGNGNGHSPSRSFDPDLDD